MWEKGIILNLDLTTRCNAGCPQCHRTDLNGLTKQVRLPDVVWDIETFKKAFSPEDCQFIGVWDFCGVFGDPMMVPDIVKIVEYIRESNPNAQLQINTNGSIRDEDTWWNLCTAGKDKLTFFISVEGTTQEMHEIYRQNTFLDKILKNMDLVSQTQSKIRTQCLVWKHNEDHLEEIEKLCRDHGSIGHRISVTTRQRNFDKDGKIHFNNRGKPGVLERSTLKAGQEVDGYVQVDRRRYVKENEFQDGDREDVELLNQKSNSDISCEWGNKNAMAMDYNGNIHPCCFFQNPYYSLGLSSNQSGWEEKFNNHELIKDYRFSESELNVFRSPISKIVKHKWFTDFLPRSWEYQPNIQCLTQCGKCK